MILSKFVEIGICGKNIKYWEDKGYNIPRKKDNRGRIVFDKSNTKIKVKIEDLPKNSTARVKVKCEDCNKIRQTNYQSIVIRKNSHYNISGETPCPKCANSRKGGIKHYKYTNGNPRYRQYQKRANDAGLEFDLSVQEFEDMIILPCVYCGGYSSKWVSNSRGNGIDRLDNNIGYVKTNCSPCCVRCNYMKNTMTKQDFMEHIYQIYLHCFKEIK